MKTAILIDGAFYLHRVRHIFGKQTPEKAAKTLFAYCKAHISRESEDLGSNCELYRIFYYDCPPAPLQSTNPISNKHIIYDKTPSAQWRLAFLDELRKQRKTALRLGRMDYKNPSWSLRGSKLRDLLVGKISVTDLKSSDIQLETTQKGVDMRIGIDISSLAYKKQVEQIVLISGDSDFVPAAKLARREGIDFILDPLYSPIKEDLNEHIDGIRTNINKLKDGSFDGKIIFTNRKHKQKR